MNSMTLLVVFASLFRLCFALNFQETYSTGPIKLSAAASLSYSVDFKKAEISFGLKITDTTIFTSSSNPNSWLGLGISEGGMVGADIVTAEMTTDQKCNITDRYVPYAAFPRVGKRANVDPVFPLADDCQNDDSWTLKTCKLDRSTGEAILEVSRKLKAHDGQDVDIKPGSQVVIHAYGSSFEYHGATRRAATRIELYTAQQLITSPEKQNEIPSDASVQQRISPRSVSISNTTGTSIICSSHIVEHRLGSIVSFEPIIDNQVSGLVYEMALYLCKSGTFFNKYRTPRTCKAEQASPVNNLGSGCRGIAAIYNPGVTRFTFPAETGIHLSERNVYMILMTTYHNANLASNLVDSSGFLLHMTAELRKWSVGSVTLGDPFLSRRPAVVDQNAAYSHTCPAACTESLSRAITIIAGYQSMRWLGRSIATNHTVLNRSSINLLGTSFWSGQHGIVPLERKFEPGESLQTTCKYNTTKRAFAEFGPDFIDEKCVTVLWYYPLQRVGIEWDSCHFYHVKEKNKNRTICGSQSEPSLSRRNFTNPQGEDVLPLRTWGNGECQTKRECLPADGRVVTQEGQITVERLKVGDMVDTPEGWSRVVGFTHRDSWVWRKIVRLSGEEFEVSASSGHYIWTTRGYIRARDVVAGDGVMTKKGERGVKQIEIVEKRGLFNPQTENGMVFVNEVAVSCYTEATGVAGGHALMSAWRLGSEILRRLVKTLSP